MLSVIITVLIAAFISVGLVDVVKNYLPEETGAKTKTTVSVIIAAIVGGLLGFVLDKGVITIIAVVIGSIATANNGYNYLLSLIKKLKDYIEAKIASIKK